MKNGTKIAMTALAVLWMTGLAFGSLSLMGAVPVPQTTPLPAWLCAPPTAHSAIECGARQ
jgi:hypothetical protein